MNYKGKYLHKQFIKNDNKLIETLLLYIVIIVPIFLFVWLKLNPTVSAFGRMIGWAVAGLIILLYCLTHVNGFVKRNIRPIFHSISYLTTIVSIYFAYYKDFSAAMSLLVMLCFFYNALTFEKMHFLIYYLMTNLSLLGSSVYIERVYKNIYTNTGLAVFACLVVFSTIAIINLYIRNKAKTELNVMAHYDPVTDIPNRYFLNKYLKNILEAPEGIKHPLALIFIDMDQFKAINDTMGHTFGDVVLKKASIKIKDCLLEGDFIARYGGDEFVIVRKNPHLHSIKETADKIIEEFSKPFYIGVHKVEVTPSMGISYYSEVSRDAEELIKHADIAMYESKSRGRNNYMFYKKEMSDKVARRAELENGLKKALENDEFIVYYQPQIDLLTGNISGVEALIRWKHPEFGIVPPNEFIPIAEETGLIVPIGAWVLRTACLQSKTWQKSGLKPINIAVNVSYQQFKNKDFTNVVKEILRESKLDPKYLELEVTESVLRNAKDLKSILDELKPIGIKLSIDDFGVGYSSLSMLQHVEIDNLKIDMSFIRDIPESSKAVAMVKTIIEMGKNLNCNITAEGVEIKEQVDFLKENKCTLGQGYLFSRPIEGPELEKLLINWKAI